MPHHNALIVQSEFDIAVSHYIHATKADETAVSEAVNVQNSAGMISARQVERERQSMIGKEPGKYPKERHRGNYQHVLYSTWRRRICKPD